MKKILLQTIVLILISNIISAQVKIGVKGGLNIANVTTVHIDNDDTSRKSKLAYHIGGFAIIPLTKRIGTQVDLQYSNKGYQFPPILSYTAGYQSLHYINLQALFCYSPISKFNVGLGPELGYLFLVSSFYNNKHHSAKSTLWRNFDVGLDISLKYNITKALFIEARYNFGLGPLMKDIDFRDPNGASLGYKNDYYNRVFQLSIGYSFMDTKRVLR